MRINKSGFTVVELMIVIVVIAVLAALVAVSYNTMSKRALDNSLRNDLAHSASVLSEWLLDHSMSELLSVYEGERGAGTTVAWITSRDADNGLPANALQWNNIAALPRVEVGPRVTIEMIAQYGSGLAPGANKAMQEDDMFCITGAINGGKYNYRPWSNIHADYDKLLFYDSALERIVTLKELDEVDRAGQQVTCEGHLIRWREATSKK